MEKEKSVKKSITYNVWFIITVIWLLYITVDYPNSLLSFTILLPTIFTYFIMKDNLKDIIKPWIISILIFVSISYALKYNFYKFYLMNKEKVSIMITILACTFTMTVTSICLLRKLELKYIDKISILDNHETIIQNYLIMKLHTNTLCFITIICLVSISLNWYSFFNTSIWWLIIYICLILLVCKVYQHFLKRKSLNKIKEIETKKDL